MPRVKLDPKIIGGFIRQARNDAALGVKELAKMANISESTIKKSESGHYPISVKTLKAIEKILGPIGTNNADTQPNLKWSISQLRSHDPAGIHELLRAECATEGGIIQYLHIPLSEIGTIGTLSYFNQKDYELLLELQRVSLRKIANIIVNKFKGHHIHMICLTCGHGWIDLFLAKAIALRTDKQITISIVHPSDILLKHGIKEAEKDLLKIPNVSLFAYSGIYEAVCQMLIPIKSPSMWKRIVCILGPLNNYDYDTSLLSFLHKILWNDDLLLFDLIDKTHHEDDAQRIYRVEPRLNGELPSMWTEGPKRQVEQAIAEHLDHAAAISVIPSLAAKSRFSGSIGDYAVELIATIDDGKKEPWSVSGMRIYRHFFPNVVHSLTGLGWEFIHRAVQRQELGLGFGTSLVLFCRKGRPTRQPPSGKHALHSE